VKETSKDEAMEYDPIKNRLNSLIRISPGIRRLFFAAMDLLLLRQAYVKQAIARYAPRGQEFRFYDAGAGFCQYSYHVLKLYPEAKVFATDLKKDYLQHFASSCRNLFGNRFHYQEADLQTFCPKLSYDLAIAIDIMEHIEDDRAVLHNFYNCLKPGGKLIISTPSDLDEAAKFTSEHVRPGYNKQELETKLFDAGFAVIESRFSYGRYGSLAWKLLMKFPLSLLGKSKALGMLLPFYYLPVLPIGMILNHLDQKTVNHTGTGLLVVAEK